MSEMLREVAKMRESTTLTVNHNTAAQVRLIRAELGVKFDRIFTLDQTVQIMLNVYKNSADAEQIIQATIAQMLGDCA